MAPADSLATPFVTSQAIPGSRRRSTLVFAITSFLSAFLLFQVQLIVSKYILPWFGGSAAVWTTSMLVFQLLLLAGYLYSHWLTQRAAAKSQTRIHLSVLFAALALVLALSVAWPSAITPSVGWKPLNTASPVRDVVAILLIAAGLPFFVLSTTGPLLQHWFARQGADTSTYRLYSVSNLGSLLGLLTFPLLLEPSMRMTSQGKLWAILFTAFVAGAAWCALSVRGISEHPQPAADSLAPATATNGSAMLWIALAGCASALLLATTNLLCQEITAIPLLWVLPLSIYLLSFILCFDHPRWYRREIFHPLFAIGIGALWTTTHLALHTSQVVVMPLLLFVTCMICHGELVRLKPGLHRLTSFYLAISAGGALGGVFVAIVAPRIFAFFTEFQLSLALSLLLLLWCLFRDEHSWIYEMGFWHPAAVLAVTLLSVYATSRWIPALPELLERFRFYPLTLLVAAFVLLGAFIQRSGISSNRKSFRAGQPLIVLLAVLALFLLYETAQPAPGLVLGKRNFYGALRVYELAQGGKALFHGQTIHGAQLDPPNSHLPMVYYSPDSGIGVLLQNHPKRSAGVGLRMGVVGLGAGTLAAYGRPGDYFRYYEINPDVIELSAASPPVFTYVRDSQAKVDVELGDARLMLEREIANGQPQNLDILVLDAFSGDAVPVHLLTTEAFDTYWKHVNPDHGIIAIHVSSRHINLMPLMEGVAQHYNARILARFVPEGYPFLDNLWVFLAKHPEDLDVTGLVANPPPFPNHPDPRVWTDDYSDILRLLY